MCSAYFVKKRTQTNADAAQKIDAAYREHPKNEMLIDIVRTQKRYDDSENTDEFYLNIGDSGPSPSLQTRSKLGAPSMEGLPGPRPIGRTL